MAMNTMDGALYFKKSDNTIITAVDNTILHIDSSNGRVGINTTSPVDALDVDGKIRTNDRVLSNTYQSTSTYGLQFSNSAGAIQMFKSDAGDLGIGTTSPAVALHIVRSGTDAKLRIQDSDGTNQFTTISQNGGQLQIFARNNTSNGSIQFFGNNGSASTEYARFNNSGFLGIGTTSPASKLHVSDGGNTGVEIIPQHSNNRNIIFSFDRGGTGYKTLDFDALDYHFNPSGTEKMRLTNDGKLGIGTTAPATKLHVAGGTDTADTVRISGGHNSRYLAVRTFENNSLVGAGVILNASSSGGAFKFQTTSTDRMIIDNNGNVGIGTTNPQTGLQVVKDWVNDYGSINISSGQNVLGGLGLRANSVYKGGLIYRDGTAGAYWELTAYANEPFLFKTNNAERMRISNGGNVGIGTTSPSQPLHVEGNVRLADAASIQFGSSFYQTITGQAGSNDLLYRTYQDHVFKTGTGPSSNTDGTTRMVIDVNGNVGIGTTSPNVRLHIADTSGDTTLAINNSTQVTGNTARIDLRHNGITGSQIKSSNVEDFTSTANRTSDLTFVTRNNGTFVQAMHLQEDGNVGIGTTSPGTLHSASYGTTKLHVDGGTDRGQMILEGNTSASVVMSDNGATANSRVFITQVNDGLMHFKSVNDNGTSKATILSMTSAGAITFNSAFTFPTSIGSAGQVLKVPNSGSVLIWSDQTGGGGATDTISDADGDTKIQVEENSDDDAIRFDVAGSQKMILTSAGRLGVNDSSPQGVLHVTSDSTTVDALYIESNEASSSAAPVVTLHRHSASPADSDYLGQLKFKGENDADQEVVYAKITAKIQDASDGSEDGLIEFANRKAGSNNIGMRLRSDSLQLLNDTNFVVGDITMSGSTVSDAGDFDLDIGGDITLDAGGGDIRLKDDGTQFGRFANFLGSLAITSGASDTAIIIGDANGNQIVGGDISFTDNKKLKLGAGNDLQIYHDATHSYIDNNTGSLYISSTSSVQIEDNSGNDMITAGVAGAVTLFHNGSAKFATASSGAAVTGDLAISGNLTVNGTTTSVSSTNTTITDALIELGSGNTSANTNDLGLILERGTTGNNVFIGWDESEDKVAFGTTTATGSSTGNVSYSRASIIANSLDLTNHIDMADNAKIRLGNSDDLQIHHDGTNNLIQGSAGNVLYIQGRAGVNSILVVPDGAVNLYHNNTARLATTSTGINVTGIGTFTGGELYLGEADVASGHINAFENMTFNIDSDNDDTNRFFEWNKNGNSGSGTELMRLTEDARLGINTSSPATTLHVNGEITIPASIVHEGDSDTFFGFHTNNQWRVVTGGTERIEVRDGGIVINDGGNDYNFRVETDGDSNCLFVDGGLNRVGIGTNAPKAKIQVEELGIETTNSTTSATTQVTLASLDITHFRSARFTIQITNSTDNTYHTTELLALHDGTTANITEFGTIFTGAALEATFDAAITSGFFRLQATPASSDTMLFKVIAYAITV